MMRRRRMRRMGKKRAVFAFSPMLPSIKMWNLL